MTNKRSVLQTVGDQSKNKHSRGISWECLFQNMKGTAMVANKTNPSLNPIRKRGSAMVIAIIVAVVVGLLVAVVLGSAFFTAVDKRVQEKQDFAKVQSAEQDFLNDSAMENALMERRMAGENVDAELAELRQRRMDRMQSLEGQVSGDVKALMGINVKVVGELHAAVERFDALVGEFGEAGGLSGQHMQQPGHMEKLKQLDVQIVAASKELLAMVEGLPQQLQDACDEAGVDARTAAQYKREFLKSSSYDEMLAKTRKSVEVWESIHALVHWLSEPENAWQWNPNTNQVEFYTNENVEEYNALHQTMQANLAEEARLMRAYFQANNGQ